MYATRVISTALKLRELKGTEMLSQPDARRLSDYEFSVSLVKSILVKFRLVLAFDSVIFRLGSTSTTSKDVLSLCSVRLMEDGQNVNEFQLQATIRGMDVDVMSL